MLNKLSKIDLILFLCSTLLLGVGLAVLYSISMAGESNGLSVFWRQVIFSVLGFATMIFFTFTDYQILKTKSTLIYFLTILCLIFVLVFGQTIRGTAGWIGVGIFHIQPVEIAKLALVVFLSSFISQKKTQLGEAGRLIASFILSLVIIGLIVKQPDFGSAMVLLGIWLGMTIVSGISLRKVIIIMLTGAIVAGAGWFQLQEYQKNRILSLVKSDVVDPRGSGYNVIQSMVAVGSGGLIGKGIGHGSQSQLNFLPEKHTDFIFASIAEELGLFGSLFVIAIYSILFYRMYAIAKSAPDNFGYLVVVGIMLIFFVQVFENIGMNIGIMPVTGIPLPFLSYGGSSLIAIFASIGILNNINSKKEAIIQSQDYIAF